ncbi:cache domain-containing protein, partial [bacterium]|nr:cache domain-containing protein [candidate division CSSED10-310 bacterium]
GTLVVRTANSTVKGKLDMENDELMAAALREKCTVAGMQLVGRAELTAESPLLADRLDTGAMSADTGMVIKAVAPVLDDTGIVRGVLYGGRLLNGNLDLVEEIAGIIFKGEKYRGKNLGTVSLFQGNVRIATDAVKSDGVRALGTLVDDNVKERVLGENRNWVAAAFIMNDRYLTAYKPITTVAGETIGILGLGILEQKYDDVRRKTLLVFLGITLAGVLGALVIAYISAEAVTRPIKRLAAASARFAAGDFNARAEFKSDDELGAFRDRFNAMAQAIQERDARLRTETQMEVQKADRLAMIGRLSAGIAHEINNPLGSILLFTRLLLQKAPREGVIRDNLDRIERDTKRCQTIVQGLLDFARQREPKIEPLDVNELLGKTMRLFEGHPSFHNIEVNKDLQSGLPLVQADAAQLIQVFVNIIMNATDAMGESGVLTLTTSAAGDGKGVQIRFSDTGCGINEEDLDKLFEPFFTTKAVGHGTGLGLSISYGIIRKHGGSIKVFSRPGEGSTFVIMLPVDGGGA